MSDDDATVDAFAHAHLALKIAAEAKDRLKALGVPFSSPYGEGTIPILLDDSGTELGLYVEAGPWDRYKEERCRQWLALLRSSDRDDLAIEIRSDVPVPDAVSFYARRTPRVLFELAGLANVTWLEARPYAELPDYLAWVDAGIIPFRPSAVTHATSPIKLFEYMAAGIPPVITPMDESVRHPQAIVADTPEAWSNALDRALARGRDKAFRAEIDHVARMNTWEMRAEKVLTALEQRAMKARAFGQAGDHHD